MDLTEAREADIKSYGGAEKLALKFSYLRELLELERVFEPLSSVVWSLTDRIEGNSPVL